MESANNPKSFLFLPPEIRLLIYRYLLTPEAGSICISQRRFFKWKSEGPDVAFFDPILKRKVRGRYEARNLPCSALPLFRCNSTIYQEAARVFFAENTFRFYVSDGEADWALLYEWLEMIGRRNICRLKHLEIVYESDVRIHEGNQRISARKCNNLSGVARRLTVASYDTWLDGTSHDWFEVISPRIERVFRKLSWSDNPLIVTMLLPDCREELVPRLLYPEVDLQEYDPLPLFNPFHPRETSFQEWEYHQAGARYSPKEFCMVPDLIEGYRKKYGKDTLTVQWKGSQVAAEWAKTKDLLLRCGWEILHWEEKSLGACYGSIVIFTLRLGRDLTHGCV
ncbi:uncharacterized protein CDV56_105139 [Aspergillus thermomutatus]|uniref:DUF7730 domain-containing protein n=1 Tax=Aspergillus thermomutatus TaxID=41047 RepID=A0A397G9R3_ASPTH|nr:uncharacterized protein CDV56_105139 [Aspergillus thermomutatus]RHZ46634.1 hypothetical protein CDV56_105139 [Aspergillus thermomutatus]